MFGLTEFNVFKTKKGWVINLCSGKNDDVILKGVKNYKTGESAYNAAERFWKRLCENAKTNELPVRYVDIP